MNVLEYVQEFEEDVILAYELEGKYEVVNYAKYWMEDIYSFSKNFACSDLSDSHYKHYYNQSGNIEVERIADEIYEQLKNFKLFAYYYDVCQMHMRDVVNEMKYTPQSYLSEESIEHEDQIDMVNSLYDIDDCLPLPLSTYNLFSYIEDEYTPDMLEYEGLRRTLDEMKRVMPIEYAFTNEKSYISDLYRILADFTIPIDKNVDICRILYDNEEYVKLSYFMNGIEGQKATRKLLYFNIYQVNFSGLDLIEVIQKFLSDAILVIIGRQKAKGSDTPAIYGSYPMKDMDFHGLKLSFPLYLHEKMIKIYELQSLNIIKQSLLLPGKPVVSSSYGVDSVLVQKLISKVYPSIDTFHGRTGLNYPEVYKTESELIRQGIMDKDRLYYGKYKKSFWTIVDDYGFNFERKGDRRENAVGKKVSVSELCCDLVKHVPFKEAVEHNDWNINFAGLRADESRTRELAAKRDGPLYFAKSWNLFRINPILMWTDSMVWIYTRQEAIPYCSIYDMVLYDDNGEVLYKPRIGCWSCLLTAKYGYLKWLRKFKPKLYRHLMIDRGLLKLLYAKKFGNEVLVNENGKEYVNEVDMDVDQLFDFIEHRPCFFDDTIAEL